MDMCLGCEAMLFIAFERPRMPHPFMVNEYATIYRVFNGVDVVFEYDGKEVLLGADLTVSRRIPGVREGHAKIFRYGGRYSIIDLCSKNGVIVDGVLLRGELRGNECLGSERELKEGNLVIVGMNTAFRIVPELNMELLPAGAYIIRDVAELKKYADIPGLEAFPYTDKQVIIKLPDKPGVYAHGAVKLEGLYDNRKVTTVDTLAFTLLALRSDIWKEDVEAYERHVKVVLDILESKENELELSVERKTLNLLKYTSSEPRNALRDLKIRRDIDNAILQLLNAIQIRYGITIPI